MTKIETIDADSEHEACDLYEIIKISGTELGTGMGLDHGYHVLSPEGRAYGPRAGQRRVVSGPHASADDARDSIVVCECCGIRHAGECYD